MKEGGGAEKTGIFDTLMSACYRLLGSINSCSNGSLLLCGYSGIQRTLHFNSSSLKQQKGLLALIVNTIPCAYLQ